MPTKVFVGNLNFRTTEQQLATVLGGAGQVTSVYMGTDRETGRSRGFAFVEFASPEEAAEAIKKFDGHEIDGRKLRVNIAEERPRPSHGGPRFGAPRGDGMPSFARPMPPDSGSFGGDFGGGGGDAGRFKNKGSRRGLRRRKRSVSF